MIPIKAKSASTPSFVQMTQLLQTHSGPVTVQFCLNWFFAHDWHVYMYSRVYPFFKDKICNPPFPANHDY